ncbi:hypothetical protein BG003_010688, partial [Podila horticola]
LSMNDIMTCRRVSRQWASIFKPNLWNHITLASTRSFSKDLFTIISERTPWIRSLTIAAPHIFYIRLLNLTTLQELVLYDESFGTSYQGNSLVSEHTVATLINNNKSLWHLEIDLNNYNYKSKRLTPALMLAIGRHPSLTKLTWHIPDDLDTCDFTQCLLRVCHTASIQELHLASKRRVGFRYRFRPRPSFTHKDFHDQGCGQSAEDKALLQKFEVPLEQLKEPFKFTTLSLAVESGADDILLLLQNCPRLQNIRIDLADAVIGTQIPGIIADHCPRVRGLDLRIAWEAMDCVAEMRRFRLLRRVRIPFVRLDQVEQIVAGLAHSSLESLEVLGMVKEAVSPEVVVSILETFPNLREIDFGMVKIDLQEDLKGHMQSEEDLETDDAIVQEWEPSQTYRPIQTMEYWWGHWKLAKKFMKEVLKAYEEARQQRVIRPIHMKYMYPIRHFVVREVAYEHASRRGAWADGRRSWTIEDAKRIMGTNSPFCESTPFPHCPDPRIDAEFQVQESMVARIAKAIAEFWR